MIVECVLYLGNRRKKSKAFNTEGTKVTEKDAEESAFAAELLSRRTVWETITAASLRKRTAQF
jgi:hypothetical protein